MASTLKSQIITGYSYPMYLKHMSSTPTTSDIKEIARGVDVSVSAEVSDVVKFYANNDLAESASGSFTSGTLTMTIDGLQTATINDIFGHETETDDTTTYDWTYYKTTDSVDSKGLIVGFIVRFEAKSPSTNEQTTFYMPFILPKVKFKESSLSAATQEADISFQTESLEGTIYRDTNNSSNKNIWKYVGAAYSGTAAETTALNALKAKMIELN